MRNGFKYKKAIKFKYKDSKDKNYNSVSLKM